MPKFRGLPRGKKPDYFGPKQQRYNTPRAVGDWETRPSRGNRKWSFFLRGKPEQGLRFQIDDPFAARKYRSFRRMWCRSLKVDPIPFIPAKRDTIPSIPISDNGQARGWRFLTPTSPDGYWEVVAVPVESQESVFCLPESSSKACISYIDPNREVQTICTENLGIRYDHEQTRQYRVSLDWIDPDTSTPQNFTVTSFDRRINLQHRIIKVCDPGWSTGGPDDGGPSNPEPRRQIRNFTDRRVVPWPEATAYVKAYFQELSFIRNGRYGPYGTYIDSRYPLWISILTIDVRREFTAGFGIEVPDFESKDDGVKWEQAMIAKVQAELNDKISSGNYSRLHTSDRIAGASAVIGSRTWGFGVAGLSADKRKPAKAMLEKYKPLRNSEFNRLINTALREGGFL